MSKPDDPLLSVVIPCFNEAGSFETLRVELEPALERAAGSSCEIVLVDDGSRDATLERMLDWRRTDARVVVISLARNFGKEAALSCGLHLARGQAVAVLDADLQDPPSLLPSMMERWREGFDVVLARRLSRRKDDPLKRITARAFYRLMGWLAESMVPPQVGDFRLLDRRVVDALARMPERARFMKGLMNVPGFRTGFVDYDRSSRRAGSTHLRFWQLWNLALEGITSFSSVPLRAWSYLGTVVSLVGMSYAGWIVMRTVLWGVDVPGYASIVTIILFFSGLQLISIGILGEYIGRILVETKRRPLYVVDRIEGLPESWLIERREQVASDPIWPETTADDEHRQRRRKGAEPPAGDQQDLTGS